MCSSVLINAMLLWKIGLNLFLLPFGPSQSGIGIKTLGTSPNPQTLPIRASPKSTDWILRSKSCLYNWINSNFNSLWLVAFQATTFQRRYLHKLNVENMKQSKRIQGNILHADDLDFLRHKAWRSSAVLIKCSHGIIPCRQGDYSSNHLKRDTWAIFQEISSEWQQHQACINTHKSK